MIKPGMSYYGLSDPIVDEHGHTHIEIRWCGGEVKYDVILERNGGGISLRQKEWAGKPNDRDVGYLYPGEAEAVYKAMGILLRMRKVYYKEGLRKQRERRKALLQIGQWSRRRQALRQGKCVQSYWLEGDDVFAHWAKKDSPEADCYVTNRNGDTIVMLVPKGTPIDKLPETAKDYIAFQWGRVGLDKEEA